MEAFYDGAKTAVQTVAAWRNHKLAPACDAEFTAHSRVDAIHFCRSDFLIGPA